MVDSDIPFSNCSHIVTHYVIIVTCLVILCTRLPQEEWELADILIVTDGEIPFPGLDVMEKLKQAETELGLEVHGLLVGRQVSGWGTGTSLGVAEAELGPRVHGLLVRRSR